MAREHKALNVYGPKVEDVEDCVELAKKDLARDTSHSPDDISDGAAITHVCRCYIGAE